MHVDITPRALDVAASFAVPVTIVVSNTSDVIAGYRIRFLGCDPRWVELPEDDISLFPEETRAVVATLTVPEGLAAGERRISVQVTELTGAQHSVVEEIVLRVPSARAVKVNTDPANQTAGRRARFNLLVENTGNTALTGHLHGQDAEGKVSFQFTPPTVDLAPGEHAVVGLKASARQAFMGSPQVRLLDLHVVDELPPTPPMPPRDPGLRGRLRRRRTPQARVDDTTMPASQVTVIQQPFVARGLIALLGLLAAVTVFALVITLALSRIVGQSAADRNLALEIAAARDQAGNGGSSSMSGTVRLLTSGTPVPGVAVNVFAADSLEEPLSTTATDDAGAWSVSNLAAGAYKVTFRGAGFVQLWWPRSLESAQGTAIELEPGVRRAGLDVDLGGVPASIAGTVKGDDVSAATLTLRTPGTGTSTAPTTTGSSSPGGTEATTGAVVSSVPIGSEGSFTLANVPSPSVYDLVVEKKGYATTTQRIDVGAGEERTGVELTLRKGDGIIAGQVTDASGPVSGATVQVSSGTSSTTARSLTDGDVGSFNVRNLPTPGNYTVRASKQGYASMTQTLSLSAGQRLTGLSLNLSKSSGSLRGTVRSLPFDTLTGGVLVSVTDGQNEMATATQSQTDPGSWRVEGLALPGTYTVTFSRKDLESLTISAVLDASGGIVSQDAGVAVDKQGLRVTMQPSTAILEGTIKQRGGSGGSASTASPSGEVTVELSTGTSTYTVTTASVPADLVGQYRIQGLPPGTYTVSVSRNGVSPTSEIIQLRAGQVRNYSPTLAAPAQITGLVRRSSDQAPVVAGWVVELYRADAYPGTPVRTTRTNAAGRFTFDDIDAPERYVVQVRRTAAGAPRGSVTVQVARSTSVPVIVEAQTS